MTLRFTVLASGSAGNATVVQSNGFGLLIDAGLGPRQLEERLAQANLGHAGIHAMLLSHTHTDHWNDRTLAWLLERESLLYCHPSHHRVLKRYSPAFGQMEEKGLVQDFVPGQPLSLSAGLRCLPMQVRHDSADTFGFRLDGPADLFERSVALGYASDLGCWNEQLVEVFRDVDLLAVEFNHDIGLEYQSKRPAHLIARVLGDEGHLSNDQAAAMVAAVVAKSSPGRLQHVVQLHLSEDCNRPQLAKKAAANVLDEMDHLVRIHTAAQHEPGKTVVLEPDARPRTRRTPAARG